MKKIFALALLLGLGMMVGCGEENEAGWHQQVHDDHY